MRIFRYMALALALIIVLAAAAWQQQQTTEEVKCGNVSGGVSRVFEGVQNARAAGQWMRRWATTDAPSNLEVALWVHGVGSVLGAWVGTFVAEATGQPVPAEVEAIETRHAAALQAAEDACTPCQTDTAAQPDDPGQAPSSEPEWDPKNAALKGPELTADALRKAGFPADEIPTFMAIAEYESSHNPNEWNDHGLGMAGLFQLNQEHWQLKDWRNPYANAKMAKRVRDDSVKRGQGPYQPWSVHATAIANAHRYAKYGAPAAVGAGAGAATPEPGRPGAKAAARAMGATYTTYHPDPSGKPSMDMGIASPSAGSRLARYLIDNRGLFNIEYVIHAERIYSDSRGWDTGSPYTRRADGDWQHREHVHATFNSAAAAPGQEDPGALTEQSEQTPEFCLPSAEASGTGGLGVTVGTWNVLLTNSAGNVNRGAGFADLVGLQEIRGKHRPLRVPGYAATPGGMAVPIIWRTNRLELVKSKEFPKGWKREETLTGSVHKNVVYGVWRSLATGETFAAINTHQYVLGGAKWREQARKVEAIRKRLRAKGYRVVLLGDMNAAADQVRAWFGASGSGGSIDRIVPYGLKASKTERLGKMGSDHRRVRVTFPAPKAASSAAALGKGGGTIPADFDRQGNPRTAAEAVAWLTTAAKRDGMNGERVSGRCERYMNLAYGLSSGYDTARLHWQAAGPTFQGPPPRGALVFWDTENSAGHVAMSVGNGRVISTDYDATTGRFREGSIDEGPITDLDKWGKRYGWRVPNFKVGSGA